MRQGRSDIVDQLLQLFLDSTPELLEELHAAVDNADAAELKRAAHKLKGSCQNVGASFMATLASALERGDATAGAVDELEAAYEPTRDALIDALGGTG